MGPGSSPLARGLRQAQPGGHGLAGIIPARAGFTPPGATNSKRAADHPRSRGVYRPRGAVRRTRLGSSPLARGLHASGGRGLVLSGIIPARAGFTSRGKAPRFLRRDHPRSRGVYWPASPTNSGRRGSSPLARGLLALLLARLLVVRIIPARAGFTGSPAGGRRARRDHPRSRGVYHCSLPLGLCAPGSSPLARGLPNNIRCLLFTVRIIPARAGFTRRRVLPSGRHGDHPRSRGVYTRWRDERRRSEGSSPLARGLRPDVGTPVIGRGIIPARAGFTKRKRPVQSRAGIIPARAGFTASTLRSGIILRDHPRSRGVYAAYGERAQLAEGSSPLARGLQQRPIFTVRTHGIIPARAGFTGPPRSRAHPCRDHPRSRGVYEDDGSRRVRRQGSSPLARGLRD